MHQRFCGCIGIGTCIGWFCGSIGSGMCIGGAGAGGSCELGRAKSGTWSGGNTTTSGSDGGF